MVLELLMLLQYDGVLVGYALLEVLIKVIAAYRLGASVVTTTSSFLRLRVASWLVLQTSTFSEYKQRTKEKRVAF